MEAIQEVQDQEPTNPESLTKPVCVRCSKEAPWFLDSGICPTCDWSDGLAEEKRKLMEGKNSARRQELIESMGEGAAEKFTLEKFQVYDDTTKKAFEACQVFRPSTGSLYLFGVPGCGKTHLAVAMALKAFDDGKSVYFFPSGPSLSRWFRGLEAREEEARIKQLSSCDLLVINELGIGRDTEFSVQMAVEVIDGRIMKGKSGLVVTSNLHPRELAAKMNDTRLESRFTGMCKILEVGTVDYRKSHRQG